MQNYKVIIILSFIVFLSSGLWLLNDVIPNEDLIFISLLERGNLRAIWENVSWSNAHAAIIPYSLLTLFNFPPLLLSRILGLLFLFFSGLFYFHLTRFITGLGRKDAIYIAALSVVWPGYMLYFSSSLFSYPFFLTIFLFGMLQIFKSHLHKGNKGRFFLFLGILFTFISFVVNSLIVYYYALLVCYFLQSIRKNSGHVNKRNLIIYVKKYSFLLSLPLVYWVSKQCFALFNAVKPAYNTIFFDFDLTLLNIIIFAKSILFASLPNDLFEFIAFIGSILVLMYFFRFSIIYYTFSHPYRSRSSISAVSTGGLLLLAAILPYLLVGKAPGNIPGNPHYVDTSYWYTRHLLLVGYPLSLIIFFAIKKFKDSTLHFLPNTSQALLFGGLIFLYSADRIRHCIEFQLIGIQDQALISLLKSSPLAKNTYVYGISSTGKGFNYLTKPDYTWPYFMQRAFTGDLNRFVYEESAGQQNIYYQSTPYSSSILQKTITQWSATDRTVPGYITPPAFYPQLSIVIDDSISVTKNPFYDVFKYWFLRVSSSQDLSAFIDTSLNVRLIQKELPISKPP